MQWIANFSANSFRITWQNGIYIYFTWVKWHPYLVNGSATCEWVRHWVPPSLHKTSLSDSLCSITFSLSVRLLSWAWGCGFEGWACAFPHGGCFRIPAFSTCRFVFLIDDLQDTWSIWKKRVRLKVSHKLIKCPSKYELAHNGHQSSIKSTNSKLPSQIHKSRQ